MSKSKSIIAVGIMVLFLGLAVSPATAQEAETQDLEIGFRDLDGKIASRIFKMSERDLVQFDNILADIMDRIQTASSYDELLEVVNDALFFYSKFPIVVWLLKLFIKSIVYTYNLDQIIPLRTRALVLSWGFGDKLIPFLENKVDLYRPLTLWYYAGRSNFVFINSRTVIIDLYPFHIKTLSGRQVGMMINFAGLYIYRHSTIPPKSYTFFMGKTAAVRGFDLSILNILGQ